MARGCSESDSEEERHDRFRSERNNSSLTASKSLYSTGLQQSIKSRSPLRRLNSPSRRDRRSPSKRSRSRSKRRSKERKKSKDRRESKEKSKKDLDKSCRRSSSKNKESRRNDSVDSVKLESSRRRSRSKGSRRSGSKEKKKKRENKRSYTDDQTDDTFLQRFERRRPSVENEIIESTIVYRDSSSEPESRVTSKSSHGSKSHKKEKKIKKTHGDAEEGELISEEENNCFGPALPPARIESEEEDGEVKDNVIAEGPALPPGFNKRTIGPALPERYHSRRRSISQEEQHTKCQSTNKSDSDEDRKCERTNLIGPSLPPTESLTSVKNPDDDKEVTLYGPALPPQPATSQDFEEPLIGPLPQGMELDDRVQRILEERAQSLKKQMENKVSWRNGRGVLLVEHPILVYSCLSNIYTNICSVQYNRLALDLFSWVQLLSTHAKVNITLMENQFYREKITREVLGTI
uniref:Putative serine/arginine-rich splicing factor 4 n=1 Tax=Panstrongylus lignarius TaxID=156445 RepID=A0A224XG37_9HEMI